MSNQKKGEQSLCSYCNTPYIRRRYDQMTCGNKTCSTMYSRIKSGKDPHEFIKGNLANQSNQSSPYTLAYQPETTNNFLEGAAGTATNSALKNMLTYIIYSFVLVLSGPWLLVRPRCAHLGSRDPIQPGVVPSENARGRTRNLNPDPQPQAGVLGLPLAEAFSPPRSWRLLATRCLIRM